MKKLNCRKGCHCQPWFRILEAGQLEWSAVELARFMNECIDRGVNTFDTAEFTEARSVKR